MNITLLSSLISAGLAAVLAAGAAWHVQGTRITQMELDHANERIATQHAARSALERSLSRLSTAQAQAQSRARVGAAELDANAAGLIGLRNTSASVRAAATTPDASAAYAAAVSELFERCGQELVRVAGQADGHASDVKTLTEAWPQ